MLAAPEAVETGELRDRNLHLVIEIFPLNRCPLKQLGGEATVEDIRPERMDQECHCEFIVEYPTEAEGGRRVAYTENDHDDCPCCTFCDYGCIPNVIEIREGSMLVETYVEDRDQAFELMQGLDSTPARVELKHITNDHDGGFSKHVSHVDLSSLTQKQRQALDAAVSRGYFQSPRKATLEDLASEFDISKQAFAQRLSSAERKVMQQVGREDE